MDLLPSENCQYGTQEYWDERYSKEADDSSFDWFKTYDEIKDLINRFTPDQEASIVMLGCGNSTLSRDMYDDGYHNIHNIDYSPIVIEKMAKTNAERVGMTWTVADIRALPFPSSSIDICLDKGTLDALMTAKGLDPWNPPAEMVANVKGEIDEVVRVLKPTGRFLYLTFGQPHFRRQHLQRPGWKLDILEVGEGFSYYFYVLEREDRAVESGEATGEKAEGS
ncbi:hypothetical protein JCM6882_008947 [Rhodosporidiobolus microsporus]